jgi:CheY-like chemotaxis protein
MSVAYPCRSRIVDAATQRGAIPGMAKILVIDDDAGVRSVISDILAPSGHSVVTAENGRRGLALFLSDPPDLVITDIMMPEQDGIETLREILHARWDAKVIVISGGGRSDNTDFLESARLLGAADIVAKPFDPDDLLRRVDHCLATA